MLYDVFLSHNSKDKVVVRELRDALENKGITTWLDEDKLTPGGSVHKGLEEGLSNSGSIIVAFGPQGIGPWEDEETSAALHIAITEKRRVIPVLLPGVKGGRRPKLPVFLRDRRWVDLRAGINGKALEELYWGISGKKPDLGEFDGHQEKTPIPKLVKFGGVVAVLSILFWQFIYPQWPLSRLNDDAISLESMEAKVRRFSQFPAYRGAAQQKLGERYETLALTEAVLGDRDRMIIWRAKAVEANNSPENQSKFLSLIEPDYGLLRKTIRLPYLDAKSAINANAGRVVLVGTKVKQRHSEGYSTAIQETLTSFSLVTDAIDEIAINWDGSKIWCASVSENGRFACIGGTKGTEGYVEVYDLKENERGFKGIVDDAPIRAMQFLDSSGRQLLIGGESGEVRKISYSDDQLEYEVLSMGSMPVVSLKIHPDGKTASAGFAKFGESIFESTAGGGVSVFSIESPFNELWTMDLPQGAWDVDWSPDGSELLAGCDDGNARILYPFDESKAPKILPLRPEVDRVSYDPSGNYIFTAESQGVARIFKRDQNDWRLLDTQMNFLYSVADVSRYGINGASFATIDRNGAVRVWSTPNQIAEAPTIRGDGWVGFGRIALMPKSVAVMEQSRNKKYEILHISENTPDSATKKLEFEEGAKTFLLNGQGRIATRKDGAFTISGGELETMTIEVETEGNGSIELLTNGAFAIYEKEKLFIRNGSNGASIGNEIDHSIANQWTPGAKVLTVACGNDGSLVATADSKHFIHLWDGETHTPIWSVEAGGGFIMPGQLAMDPSEKNIAFWSGYFDGSGELSIMTVDGEQIPFPFDLDGITCLAFSDDSTLIVQSRKWLFRIEIDETKAQITGATMAPNGGIFLSRFAILDNEGKGIRTFLSLTQDSVIVEDFYFTGNHSSADLKFDSANLTEKWMKKLHFTEDRLRRRGVDFEVPQKDEN